MEWQLIGLDGGQSPQTDAHGWDWPENLVGKLCAGHLVGV